MGATRSGKSSAFVPEAVYTFSHPKQNIWVTGIDYGKTDRFLFGLGSVKGMRNYLQDSLPFLLDENSIKRRDHRIESLVDSLAQGKSAKYPDSFIAEPVNLIVCEDATTYPDNFYSTYIRPRVIDTRGRILINGTPPLSKKNWFSQLWKKADGVRIAAFGWGMKDNPTLSPDDIEDLLLDTPEHLRNALIHGIAPMEDSSVFGNLSTNIMGGFTPFIPGHLYQAGLDIGKQYDRTVLAISDLTDGRLAYMDRFPPKYFQVDKVEARLMESLAKYQFPNTYVDMSGIGEMFRGMVESHPFFIPNVIGSLKARNSIIDDVAVCFARGYSIPDLDFLKFELENLDIDVKPGYYVYVPRNGAHDDCIMALGLSLRGWALKIFGHHTEGILRDIPKDGASDVDLDDEDREAQPFGSAASPIFPGEEMTPV